jgi:hypothetical protein
MGISVETYSGYKADEYPLRFRINDQDFEVIELEDRWYSPEYSYFRVFASDASHHIVRHDLREDSWELVEM